MQRLPPCLQRLDRFAADAANTCEQNDDTSGCANGRSRSQTCGVLHASIKTGKVAHEVYMHRLDSNLHSSASKALVHKNQAELKLLFIRNPLH